MTPSPTILKDRFVGIPFLSSPHFDDRPQGCGLELIVIHAISLPPNHFGGSFVEEFFKGRLNPSDHPFFETIKELKVSSHLYINRKGHLIQFVDFNKRAFHAGKSIFHGRQACNDFSLGIELEGCDTQPFSGIQYKILASAVRSLLLTYPTLSKEKILGHSDIAPGRKTDPGPFFDWAYFRKLLDTPFI